MKTFSMENNNEVSVNHFLELLEFNRDPEPNFNEWNIIRSYLERYFELFVAALANKEILEYLKDIVRYLILVNWI